MPKVKKSSSKKISKKKLKSRKVSTRFKTREFLNYALGSFLIVFGVAYLYLLPAFLPKAPVTPIKIDPKLLSEKKSTESPVKIIIPRINIDLSVTESKR